MLNPVLYSSGCSVIVDGYNKQAKKDKKGGYWEDDAVKVVRAEVKKHYQKEQEYRCCYCRQKLRSGHGMVWDVEHIAARSEYPEFMFEPMNLAVACKECNGSKGDYNVFLSGPGRKYPKLSGQYSIVHPHFDKYEDHIRIASPGICRALLKKGMETIHVCKLLRFGYEFVGVSDELARDKAILLAAGSIIGAKDDSEKKAAIELLLAIARVID